MINTDGSEINTDGSSTFFPFDFTTDNEWHNTSYMTISSEEYYKLVEKARKWDNFMKMVNGEKEDSS